MAVWSHNTRVQPFSLSGYHGRPTRGTVTIREFNRQQRTRRALAGLGRWWGVALLSVFIPVAHFILVPSFLIVRHVAVRPATRHDDPRDNRYRYLPGLPARPADRAVRAVACAAARDLSVLPPRN